MRAAFRRPHTADHCGGDGDQCKHASKTRGISFRLPNVYACINLDLTWTWFHLHRNAWPILTSAYATHTHVVGWHNFLFDWKIVSLQRIERRVSQYNVGILALVFERQQVFWADRVEGLVGLCDEARLRVFRRRDALRMFNAIVWRKERQREDTFKNKSICADLFHKMTSWPKTVSTRAIIIIII